MKNEFPDMPFNPDSEEFPVPEDSFSDLQSEPSDSPTGWVMRREPGAASEDENDGAAE